MAFKKVGQHIRTVFGSEDVEDFRWGKIHRQVFKSVPWSEVPLLKYVWERSFEVGGNSRTPNVAIHTHQTNSYNSIGGPVVRMITDIDTTLFSMDLGNTDRVLSDYYDNFMGKDLYVEYTRRNPFLEELPSNWRVSIDTM